MFPTLIIIKAQQTFYHVLCTSIKINQVKRRCVDNIQALNCPHKKAFKNTMKFKKDN